jgi:hypothetical protein
MSTSAIASSDKIQTALTNLGIPNGFIAYDTVPLLRQLVVALGNVTTGGGSGVTGSGVVTGGGTIATGGFTFTVPATGTAALLGTANVFTALQTITQGTANTGVLASTGYSVTGSNATNMIDLAGTWNTSGAPTALKINITNTASENSSKLIDLQVGGTTRFSVIPTATGSVTEIGAGASNGLGIAYVSGIITLGRSDGDGGINSATDVASWATNNNIFAVNNILAIGRAYASRDLFLTRKAAATLQMGEDAAGVTNQMFTAANRITSDGVGANLTIAAGNGRGAAGGSLILSTFDTAGAGVAGTLRSRMTFDTTGAVAFPVVTAVTTETVISDTTWPVTINGVSYKILLKA